jgi:Ca2+-binding RTX toxin-like protein
MHVIPQQPTFFPWSNYLSLGNNPFPTYDWYNVDANHTHVSDLFSSDFYNSITGDDSSSGGTFIGTAAANTFAFTTGNTTVRAGDGTNTITSTTGNKLITRGSGVDTIAVTSGDNQIYADAGANTITATSGNNIIVSGGGVDTITLTSGNNWIDAGAGANTIVATSGINLINTGADADTITTGGKAGAGNIIHAGDRANTIVTGPIKAIFTKYFLILVASKAVRLSDLRATHGYLSYVHFA